MKKLLKKKLKMAGAKIRKSKRAVLMLKRKTVKLGKNILKQVKKTDFIIPHFNLSKVGAMVLVFGIILQITGMSPVNTLAYFTDQEDSSDNAFVAGSLDFSLNAGDWEPVTIINDGLLPGDTVTRQVRVVNDGLLNFQYTVEAVKTSGDDDFCNALNLSAKRDGAELYNGDLLSLVIAPPVVYATTTEDTWLFEVNLPSSSGEFADQHCAFNFVFKGWQTDLSAFGGFSDIETLENILEGGSASDDYYLSGYNPVKDAYISEKNPNNNYGSQSDLYVRSKSGEDNRRSLVAFDFHLPATTTISFAKLKLYMQTAPSANRSYEVKRVLEDWNEKDLPGDPIGVDWNSQPTVSASVSDSVFTGTTNQAWVNWDVLSDTKKFVDGTYDNYGWRIEDTNESSTSSREAIFDSRDSNDDAHRPVLEVAFTAPKATTTHLVINEIFYDVGPGKGSDANNEWVEIYNPTNTSVDISGWKICDNSSCDTIPAGTDPILPYGFALITNDSSTWGYWPSIPTETVLIALDANIGNGLADSGDRVILKDGADDIVDEMSYGDDTSVFDPTVPESGRNKTLARIIKGYDYDTAFDWVINATPNPGTNPSEGGEEVMRFTSDGIEVAKSFNDLAPLLDGPADIALPADQVFEPECACSQIEEEQAPAPEPETTSGGGGGSLETSPASSTEETVVPVIEDTASTTPDEIATTTPDALNIVVPENPVTEEIISPVLEPEPVSAASPEEAPVAREEPAPEAVPVKEEIKPEVLPAVTEPEIVSAPTPAEEPAIGGRNE